MTKLKYDESFPERAGEYAAKGLKNIEIAAELGISEDSFYVYQRQFPEFAGAVETGRMTVADKVGGSLMDLATGCCSVTTVKRGDNGHETKTVRRRAPDVNAVIRWLERNKQYADDGGEPVEFRSSPASVNMNIPSNLKYDESFPAEAETHAGNGDTDSRIAGRLGIAPSSFYNYKKQFPEFAAALERGRRECYGRLRGQLLAIALGKCTVTTETYRDGDFRGITERQLPPNLKAVRYWLDNMSAQALSKTSESGSCDRAQPSIAEHSSAQRLSKSSECPGDDGNNGNELLPAQGLSKSSESAASSHTSRFSRTDKASARRFSKMSRKERQRLLKNRQANHEI